MKCIYVTCNLIFSICSCIQHKFSLVDNKIYLILFTSADHHMYCWCFSWGVTFLQYWQWIHDLLWLKSTMRIRNMRNQPVDSDRGVLHMGCYCNAALSQIPFFTHPHHLCGFLLVLTETHTITWPIRWPLLTQTFELDLDFHWMWLSWVTFNVFNIDAFVMHRKKFKICHICHG